jgi:hypothetical protein
MRRTFQTSCAVLFVMLVLVLTTAAGCGSSSSSDTSSPAASAASGLSAEQITKDSETKMAAVQSASFTADVALAIQGDTSKMTDPTAKAMLGQGATLHAEGQSASDPTAVDMTMSLGIAGQNLDFGMMTQGSKSWIEYQGTWYALDSKNAKTLDEQAKTGAAPTEQLKSLGLDPSTWGTTYTLVGTEDLNGTQVYHVKAVADPQKLADSLLKAVSDPSLQKKLGGASGELGQLEQSLKQNKKQAEELGNSLKDTSVDYWIGVDDSLMYKAAFAATLDTSSQKDMEGVEGVTMKGSVTMSGFNEPVTVTPPAKAESFNKLMNQMFGGLTSGTSTSY